MKEKNKPAANDLADSPIKPRTWRIVSAFLGARHDLGPEVESDAVTAARLKEAIRQQPVTLPQARVRSRIISQIRSTPQTKFRARFAWLVLIPAVIFLFWGIFKPGAVIRWEVNSGEWQIFKVYRSDGAGGEYILLDVVSISPGTSQYVYRDLALLPGKVYTYQVQAADAQGRIANSQVVMSNARDVWLMWLAVMLPASLCGALLRCMFGNPGWLKTTTLEITI